MTLQKEGTSHTTMSLVSYEGWVWGKADDVTQGGLIVPATAVTLGQDRDG